MQNTQDIKSFTDYRAFLKHYALTSKKRSSRWSYGVWASQLKLKDTSSLTKILNGQRHPGDVVSKRICDFFKFDKEDREYFRDLVAIYKNESNPRLCVALLEKMGKKFPNSDLAVIDYRSFEFFSSWYIMPLREMIKLPTFKEDANWIARQFKFKVTASDIEKGLKILQSLNLVRRNPEGRLETAHGRITSDFDQKNEGLQLYHESMLDHAKTALKKQELASREFLGLTVAIHPENLPKAKELIREFQQKFERLLDEATGTQVYQLQVQMFALTEKLNQEET